MACGAGKERLTVACPRAFLPVYLFSSLRFEGRAKKRDERSHRAWPWRAPLPSMCDVIDPLVSDLEDRGGIARYGEVKMSRGATSRFDRFFDGPAIGVSSGRSRVSTGFLLLSG